MLTPWDPNPRLTKHDLEFANPLRDLAYMPGRVNAIPAHLLALAGRLVGGLATTEAALDDVLPAVGHLVGGLAATEAALDDVE